MVGGVMKVRSGRCGVLCGAVAALMVSVAFLARPPAAHAAEQDDEPPWQSTWVGAQVAGKDWSVYTGTSYALTGQLDQDGLRLRIVGGYGHYDYVSGNTRFKGQHAFSDALLGYRLHFRDVIVKGFAGIATAGHRVSPFDPDNAATGYSYGAVGALESWINISDRTWLSVAGKYTTVFDAYAADLRLGYRWWRQTSAGLESGVNGDTDYLGGRAALFIQHTWGYGDARLSLGAAADRDMNVVPYAALNLSLKY